MHIHRNPSQIGVWQGTCYLVHTVHAPIIFTRSCSTLAKQCNITIQFAYILKQSMHIQCCTEEHWEAFGKPTEEILDFLHPSHNLGLNNTEKAQLYLLYCYREKQEHELRLYQTKLYLCYMEYFNYQTVLLSLILFQTVCQFTWTKLICDTSNPQTKLIPQFRSYFYVGKSQRCSQES